MLARHIIILHHVTMQLIKYTTAAYVNATIEEKGHDLTRIRGRNHLNVWANGEKPNVKGKTHKAVNYPFLSFVPSHLGSG